MSGFWATGWDGEEEVLRRPETLPRDHPELSPLGPGSSLRGGAICPFCPGASHPHCCRSDAAAATVGAMTDAERAAYDAECERLLRTAFRRFIDRLLGRN